MSILDLLGDSLRKPDGSTVSVKEALGDKSVLGLYFSAHWCPPCKKFTPELSEKYIDLQEEYEDFEMIFVSSDKDDKQFTEYHNSMTFPALPFDRRSEKAKLSKKFKVSGIPTLVFFDLKTNKLITDDGRSAISGPKYVEEFPYRPKPVDVTKELGPVLRKPDGTTVKSAEALKDVDVIALYFSAHWCPPCRGFTPTLSEKYTKLKEAGKKMEMVFCSSDRDEKAFNEYHSEMTFLALPYAERAGKENLSKFCNVSGIPSLCFIDAKTNKLITTGGRGAISAQSFIEDFPYYPKPVNDISEAMEGINENVCLIVLMEKAAASVQEDASKLLNQVAEAEFKKAADDLVVEKFFTAKGGGPIAQIRNGCGYADASDKPVMLILDLGDEGSYYHPRAEAAEVTKDNIAALFDDFKQEKLVKKQFSQ